MNFKDPLREFASSAKASVYGQVRKGLPSKYDVHTSLCDIATWPGLQQHHRCGSRQAPCSSWRWFMVAFSPAFQLWLTANTVAYYINSNTRSAPLRYACACSAYRVFCLTHHVDVRLRGKIAVCWYWNYRCHFLPHHPRSFRHACYLSWSHISAHLCC